MDLLTSLDRPGSRPSSTQPRPCEHTSMKTYCGMTECSKHSYICPNLHSSLLIPRADSRAGASPKVPPQHGRIDSLFSGILDTPPILFHMDKGAINVGPHMNLLFTIQTCCSDIERPVPNVLEMASYLVHISSMVVYAVDFA
ncbi:hypothetical protein BAUCODRAFT_331975 [Baudoinia panamericana UAMH 10762]|uniref:Uncharacterized protein n=1 Tax=Baudoinia panamericana (strain UAMH 10762) TaxID=717646 RepID=M2MWI6_BAUPA|nr:uncharacterized protein BAUCODRAFT_331975 [Baudoinia panamericana UAMH 10762]EMC90949.1 hypothetical protein BAUCODRAFT_331975 [Baudoinia panamericana UAMH 10762]